MDYLKVNWIHSLLEEPTVIYTELDSERWTTRIMEIFADGRIGYASSTEERGSTAIPEKPTPTLAEIASDPQFEPFEITKEEFEEMWAKRKAG